MKIISILLGIFFIVSIPFYWYLWNGQEETISNLEALIEERTDQLNEANDNITQLNTYRELLQKDVANLQETLTNRDFEKLNKQYNS